MTWRRVFLACAAFALACSAAAGSATTKSRRTSGGLIVYWSDDPIPTIWAIRPDGSGRHRILRSGQNAKRPRLSPDRRWVAFDGAPPGTPPLSEFHIQIVRVDGTGRRTLARSTQWELDAQWTPSGARLSFSRQPPGPDWKHAWIWTVRRDGTDVRRVARGQWGRWSPDGRRLVLDAPTKGSDADLFVVNANGTGRRRLTATRELEQAAAWSPDGRKILFTRFSGQESDVFSIDVNGTHLTRLTTEGRDIAGTWSPNGSRILFTSGRAGGSQLYLMDADGSHQHVLSPKRFTAYDPSWR